MSLKLKNFGLLEFLIILSAVYVVGMLIWTASTRPEVEARANLVKENHKKVVDFINSEINNCGNNDEGKITAVSYTHLRAHETGRNRVCRLGG